MTVGAKKAKNAVVVGPWSIQIYKFKQLASYCYSYTGFVQDEGKFSWVDGSPLNFTYWNGSDGTLKGENRGCVILRRRWRGYWRDYYCNRSQEFLCREGIFYFLESISRCISLTD